MGSGIFFPICALPIIIIIITIFNIKGHVNSSETKLYSSLIIVNFVALIVEILCSYACIYFEQFHIISLIVLKLYLILLILWTALFTNYIYIISFENKNKKMDSFQKCFFAIVILFIIILPIEVVVQNNNQIHYTTGLCCYFSYAASFVYILMIIYMLIRKGKKDFNKKYIPVFFFFIIGMLSVIIQINRPEILMLTYCETLICLLMFNTIENPDVKMIQELQVAREQADKANRSKTEFLSSMSHEIRTPLNAIVGFSDCIMESESLGEAKENANDIVNASQTLLEIVNGILDISKIEAGKIEIINNKYDAPETFLELAKLITPKMKEKGLDFSFNIASDLPKTLYGDHANIKKVITNLLSNAYKYTDRGFVHYEVNCVVSKGVCKLIVSVEDSGRGIRKESMEKMFTKFQRLDEDRNTTIEGTGLGLAITKQLTELMGGRIFVHTVFGQGSKFTVVINQKIEKEDISAKKAAKTTLDLHDVRVLLVDDNSLNIKVATKLLERFNANHIISCDSGFECLDKIKRGEIYDIILLDDMMPKMSGGETLIELKKLPNFNTPVVALTANAITGMKEKYLSEGFDDYLAKPIEKDELIRVCNECLGRSITEVIDIITNEVVSNEAVRENVIVDTKESVPDTIPYIIPVESNIEEILGESLDLSGAPVVIDLKDRSIEVEHIEKDDITKDLEAAKNARIPEITPVSEVDVSNTTPVEEVDISKIMPVEEIDISKIKNSVLEEVEMLDLDDDTNSSDNGNIVYDKDYLVSQGVDMDNALGLLGDMEMYNMTINDFVKEIDSKWQRINDYKNANDMKNYAIDVHSLKSDCKYLGFMKLADVSYEHELKSKENDSDFVNNNFSRLEDEYNKMIVIAKDYAKHNVVDE